MVLDVVEDVDGAVAVGVEAGLVGEEAERRWLSWWVVEGGELGEVGGFEDVDAGKGVGGIVVNRRFVNRSRALDDGMALRWYRAITRCDRHLA